MILEQGNLHHSADEVLGDHFHGFHALVQNHSRWAPFFGKAVLFIAQAEASFILCLLSFTLYVRPLAWLCGAAALALLASRLAIVVVLAVSLVNGKLHNRMHRRPMIYWSWWPCWNLAICCVAALCGALFGHFLWYSKYQQYYEYFSLQPYEDVNPAIVPGTQLQDAGLVDFSKAVDIDRSKGGCFVDHGHTYCVAPILYSGELYTGFGNAPTFGSYDYFAVGVDCCSCPNLNFRCGDWKNPLASGGLRSLDYKSRPFYRLAVDDWAASYLKDVKHPLFFEWVQDPKFQWNYMWMWATHTAFLGILAPLPVCFLIATFAAHTLRQMVEDGVASPLDTPGPPPGLERAWSIFLPELLKQFLDERRQLLALPISPTPNYGAARASKGSASLGAMRT